MHNTISAIEHDIEQLESPNSNISDEALQDIERRIVDQKTKIRESLSPSTVSYTHLTLPTKRIV